MLSLRADSGVTASSTGSLPGSDKTDTMRRVFFVRIILPG
jgi:hypothetical protein